MVSQNVSMDLAGNDGPPGLNTAMPLPEPAFPAAPNLTTIQRGSYAEDHSGEHGQSG